MTDKLYDLINWADVEEIEYSESMYPKRILGAHELPEGGTLVQVYIPHAVSISLIKDDGKKPIAMEACDEEGFFAVLTSGTDFDYRLEVTYDNGFKGEIEDPYNPKFHTIFSEQDYKQLSEGIAYGLYEKLGAHPMNMEGVDGVNFAVFAPEAERVSVVGDFNMWDGRLHQMQRDTYSGIFELFIPGVKLGDLYKYEIKTKAGQPILKADPHAFYSELRPATASVVWDIDHFHWDDESWMAARRDKDMKKAPMNIYELHLGSWKQKPVAIDEEGNAINGSQFYNYRELADEIAAYVKEMGYTHVELLPIMEHPLDASWGYQVTGYFSPTSRYGTPDDFMYFVDHMHKEGIGVILDWVPAHFPRDSFALAEFDGSHVYEHADPRKGAHPHWGTLIFNYAKPQVSNFLISNAMFWAEKYHADGIRLDAVASMLYLDYGRNDGEWVANIYGGNENLDAIEFLKHLNSIMHKRNPGVMMIAEESTAWPMITGDPKDGGLGFDFKWNMGFMNDFLHYMQKDPYFRKDNYGALTFSMFYNYSENFVLTFSHDEVVHLKGSMLSKMPSADFNVKAQHLRAAYGYFMSHPDKKLLFMGQDFAQNDEWQECMSLEWDLLQYPVHKNMQDYMKELNKIYKEHPALWKYDYDTEGFEWINCAYPELSMVMFMRKADKPEETLIVVSNFDTVEHRDFRIGVPFAGSYKEILNSNAERFGGTGLGNPRAVRSNKISWDERKDSIKINIPALSTLIFTCTPMDEKPEKKAARSKSKTEAEGKASKTEKKAPAAKKTAKKAAEISAAKASAVKAEAEAVKAKVEEAKASAASEKAAPSVKEKPEVKASDFLKAPVEAEVKKGRKAKTESSAGPAFTGAKGSGRSGKTASHSVKSKAQNRKPKIT